MAFTNSSQIISTHLLIMEVDFCPVLCVPEREEVILKQLTCIFICAMLMKILKDKERVFSKQLFWITPFGVKAIRTAGSTAADGNFGCLID